MDDTRLSRPGQASAAAGLKLTLTSPFDGDAAAPAKLNRRARRGSERPRSEHFRPMDRNTVARLLFAAEAYDRATHLARAHGGALKRTGLAVLRALANRFHNRSTGRCDPSLTAIARAAGVARSTAALALARLRAAGFLDWTRRGVTVSRHVRGMEAGMFAQVSNAYRLAAVPPAVPGPMPLATGLMLNSKSEARAETRFLVKQKALGERGGKGSGDSYGLEEALARLGAMIQAKEALG